ncbi:MAG TPA: rhodanese-like domain-containing protein [Streptosporangiaceae bacterium]|jgi:hypothetical protein|nr:rhodanese-like domain-containing protein [Streptosporangiaceae bacterium]
MSPRAAWRLEAAGFGPVYDYAAGKADWLAADLPFEGSAKLAGVFTRRGVATAGGAHPGSGGAAPGGHPGLWASIPTTCWPS